jgi:hypothetical protein
MSMRAFAHMWTAPVLQEGGAAATNDCDHMYGLLMRLHMTAAKMGFATRVPNTLAALERQWA